MSGAAPEIVDDHLDGSYSFDGAMDDSALPELFVSLTVAPRADGPAIRDESREPTRRLPDEAWDPRTLEEWLRDGLTQQLHREGISVCHPWLDHDATADDIDWRILPDGYHKPGSCVEDGEPCLVAELWGGPHQRGQLRRHPITFTAGSPSAHPAEAVTLEGVWRLTLDELRAEYVGLITSAVSTLAATQESFAIELGGTHSLPVDVRDAFVVNPLYSPAEIQTALTSTSVSGEMSAKRVFWTETVRDGFTEALSERIGLDQVASSEVTHDA